MAKFNKIDKIIEHTQFVIAVLTALIFLYTAFFGSFEAIIQRTLLLLGAFLWSFLYCARTTDSYFSKVFHLILAFISIVPSVYIIVFWDNIVQRFGIPITLEYYIGSLLIISLMYIGKRMLGWGFTIIVTLFIAYALFGSHIPGIFQHSGINLDRFISTIFLTTNGIFGIVMNVAATVIIQFVIFAAFLRIWGAGDFFMNLSSSLFGHVKGGPAKIAVVGSGLTGMFNGVATANVASTGSITIPLMKKNGYPAEFAGAVEASASTGGQILPPIMGASAFVMAETLGLPISEIMKAALVPALLFFIAIYLAVDLKASKLNLRGLKKDELPNLLKTIKSGWLYFVPIIVLVVVIFKQFSPGRAAFFAIVTLILVSFFINNIKPSWKDLLEALKSGAEDTIIITIACAMSGIVIGILNMTGLGVSLGNLLIYLSADVFVLLLIFTMISSIILGMGLPTIAGYIIVSLTVAPVLVSNFGVPPIAAHLFVFYFAILSVITPPVAVASFVAAGIANTDPVRTGFTAFMIATPCFIVPFIFIYNPGIVMIGTPFEIIGQIIIGLLSIYCLAVSIQGYFRTEINVIQRILFFIAAVLFIIPIIYLTILAFALFITLFILANKRLAKDKMRIIV